MAFVALCAGFAAGVFVALRATERDVAELRNRSAQLHTDLNQAVIDVEFWRGISTAGGSRSIF